MEILAIVSLILAGLFLLWAAWIDLKLWILPNELVAAVAVLAFPYHYALAYEVPDCLWMIGGAIMGGGALWVVRAVANRIYGMETLGLGDVKLMAAVGLWLGPEYVLMALSAGALCGVIHALMIVAYKRYVQGMKQAFSRMMLPAGPGFIAGSILVFIAKEIF